MAWFSFTGSNPSDKTHYTLVSSEPNCGIEREKLCAINATNNGSNQPVLDIPILSEMADALELEQNTTNVRLKAANP